MVTVFLKVFNFGSAVSHLELILEVFEYVSKLTLFKCKSKYAEQFNLFMLCMGVIVSGFSRDVFP